MTQQQNMPTAEVLAALKEAVGRGGSSSEWIARSYVSWYRGGSDNKIDLNRFGSLDLGNRHLFTQMLGLRSQAGWDDEELWEVEKHMRAVYEVNAEDDAEE